MNDKLNLTIQPKLLTDISKNTDVIQKCFLFGIREHIAGLSISSNMPNKSLDKIIRAPVFPAETKPYIDETVSYNGYPQNAEKVNGRWAMVGFVALLGAYVTTGQIIPGIF